MILRETFTKKKRRETQTAQEKDESEPREWIMDDFLKVKQNHSNICKIKISWMRTIAEFNSSSDVISHVLFDIVCELTIIKLLNQG